MKDVAKQISHFGRKEVELLFDRCKASYKSKELVLLTTPCLLSSGRILLVTSRKVGNAPQRNKLRRQARAIFYEQQIFARNIDCVVLFRAPATKLSFDQLQAILVKYTKLVEPTPASCTNN